MGVMAVPILPGKLEAWQEFGASLEGEKSQEFDDFNKRYNLTVHRAWLQTNPDDSHLALVLHEGPGADDLIPKLAQSSHDFDEWFKGQVQELHGMDITQPPPGPPPELVIDYSQS